mmetsp:Transcript_17457/g.43481  ORF Transcript_17457/g.43481 Transcript_17457/m.43481 type:complete len:139 (-) Transcript_17457:160-576(-)
MCTSDSERDFYYHGYIYMIFRSTKSSSKITNNPRTKQQISTKYAFWNLKIVILVILIYEATLPKNESILRAAKRRRPKEEEKRNFGEGGKRKEKCNERREADAEPVFSSCILHPPPSAVFLSDKSSTMCLFNNELHTE